MALGHKGRGGRPPPGNAGDNRVALAICGAHSSSSSGDALSSPDREPALAESDGSAQRSLDRGGRAVPPMGDAGKAQRNHGDDAEEALAVRGYVLLPNGARRGSSTPSTSCSPSSRTPRLEPLIRPRTLFYVGPSPLRPTGPGVPSQPAWSANVIREAPREWLVRGLHQRVRALRRGIAAPPRARGNVWRALRDTLPGRSS
jgi:hypothetical protein